MSILRNIIFDVDGTLSFTEPGIFHCLKYTLKEMGYEIPPEHILRKCIGPPLTESFYLRLGVPKEKNDEAVRIYREEYGKNGQFMCEPYEGLDETLNGLKEEGYHLFVASSKTEKACRVMLEDFGFTKYFDDICGADLSRHVEKKIEVLYQS